MFIAMNHFEVEEGREQEFEELWRTRETYLDGLAGFVQFALLKGDEAGQYISHTVWSDRDAFLAWTQSDAFRKAHGGRMPEGIVKGHPRARFWDSVIVEEAGLTV
ncbi:MAG: antibiotic biosynthesis monooxygenase [Dehalococcoidia bacterium]|nr:antibiotic biosynthesis monooxygenase [Dehalococcoidia bacterium]